MLVIIIIQWKLVVTQKHKFPSFNRSVSHFCSCFMCLIWFPIASICMLTGLKLVTFSLDKIIRIMGFPLDSICSWTLWSISIWSLASEESKKWPPMWAIGHSAPICKTRGRVGGGKMPQSFWNWKDRYLEGDKFDNRYVPVPLRGW